MNRTVKHWILAVTCLMLSYQSVCNAEESQEPQESHEQAEIILKPQMRVESFNTPVYKLNTRDLRPYLKNIIMFDNIEEFKGLPSIIGFAGQISFGSVGNTAYVTGLSDNDSVSSYSIIMPGKEFKDPDKDEDLGFEAAVIGEASLKSLGNLHSVLIIQSLRYIPVGAKLVPRVGLDVPLFLEARRCEKKIQARILFVENENLGVGKFGLAVISAGKRDGLVQGALLGVIEPVKGVVDPQTKEKINIESNQFAQMVIYKVMDKVSLGFVLDARRPVLVGDKIVSIQQG